MGGSQGDKAVCPVCGRWVGKRPGIAGRLCPHDPDVADEPVTFHRAQGGRWVAKVGGHVISTWSGEAGTFTTWKESARSEVQSTGDTREVSD